VNVLPSLAEHTDLLQVVTVGLIGVVIWMVKKWDNNHTEAIKAITTETTKLASQLVILQKDLYELRGEHNAHHRMRRSDDPMYDDRGLKMDFSDMRGREK
jgi:hypothetical protein